MENRRAILDSFDLMSSDHFHVILHPDKKHGLIFNRLDDTISTINYNDAKELSNLRRVGRTQGIIGKFLNKYLVLMKSNTLVGSLYDPSTRKEHDVYVINQIQVIDISCVSCKSDSKSSSVLYDANACRREVDPGSREGEIGTNTPSEQSEIQDFTSLPITISSSSYASLQSRSGPWNPFKLANSLKPKIPTHLLRTSLTDSSNNNSSSLATNSIQTEDSDKRLVDEMSKLFNNTNSFYFSPTLDLTNRISKLASGDRFDRENIWKTANERFFWNRHMLKDLIELSMNNSDVNYFICVILQGFIAIQQLVKIPRRLNDPTIDMCVPATSINALQLSDSIDFSEKLKRDELSRRSCDETSKTYQLALISRRSVYHAGTRYRRRGCDERGNCANFVETEQVFRYNKHFTSFVIIRGSIPLYWYQTGYNYRPPPIICKSHHENQEVFRKHFQSLFESYDTDQIIAVDCTEHSGREKTIHDAYKTHLNTLQKTNANLKLIEFDFHKHCKGRQCSDIQVERHLRLCGLTDQLLRDIKYYWNDGEVIWNQLGIFRVNCLDCSDRTNVVQKAIALQILDLQLARLGLITPDTCPEDNDSRRLMQIMWSTNGNVLSTQYCGTRALFGTADRKLASYLQDTYSSASRYYMSKFRDAYRQAAIDAMLGVGDANIEIKAPQDGSNTDNNELINLEPLLTSRGGALLKDVGNRVTNRLVRLTEKFQNKQNVEDTESNVHIDQKDLDDSDLIAAELDDDILSDLNIDWPSSESADNEQATTSSLFATMSREEDNFQDDEFGHLMLSIDLAEIQRFKQGNEFYNPAFDTEKSRRSEHKPEEIDLAETPVLKQESIEDRTTTTTT